MSSHDDFVCNNMMCEKIGGACVCKLARYLDHLPVVREMELSKNSFDILPDNLWEATGLQELDVSGKHHL
jgi:hypothetical protein